MSATSEPMNEPLQDHCSACSADTPHQVSIQIVEENESGSPHSREPYRVKECLECGATTRERMNGGGYGRGESQSDL